MPDPTVRDMLVAKIDELVDRSTTLLDEIRPRSSSSSPTGPGPGHNAITMAAVMLDEIKLRAHARPLDEPDPLRPGVSFYRPLGLRVVGRCRVPASGPSYRSTKKASSAGLTTGFPPPRNAAAETMSVRLSVCRLRPKRPKSRPPANPMESRARVSRRWIMAHVRGRCGGRTIRGRSLHRSSGSGTSPPRKEPTCSREHDCSGPGC
jgi:hypothetical protein